MKKFTMLCLLAAFAFALAACGGSDSNETTNNNAGTTTPPAQGATTAPDAEDPGSGHAASGSVTAAATDTTPVTIRYANWNMSEPMEQMMIDEFMRRYPHITIVPDYNINFDDYMGSLQLLAASGQLPDVFAISQVPEMMALGFLQNVLPYGSQVTDWNNIPHSAIDAVTWRNGVFAVPFSMFYDGFLINDEIFDRFNVPRLEPGFSMEQLTNAVREISDIGNQIAGINEAAFFRGWLPHYFNRSVNHHGWDGTQFNLASEEYIRAVEISREFVLDKLSLNRLEPDEWAAFNAGWWWEIFLRGDMVGQLDGSWWIGTWTDTYRDGMDIRFVGLPGDIVSLTPTYAGISTNAENPAAAMHFLQWMSFGSEGIAHRLYLRDSHDVMWGFTPMTTDYYLLRRFFDGAVPGVERALQNMDNAIIQGEATIPGFVTALWTGNTGLSVIVDDNMVENATPAQVIMSALQGNINYADYADRLNEFANGHVRQVQAEIDMMLDLMGF